MARRYFNQYWIASGSLGKTLLNVKSSGLQLQRVEMLQMKILKDSLLITKIAPHNKKHQKNVLQQNPAVE